MRKLSLRWHGEALPIHSWYFGYSPLIADLKASSGYLEEDGFPDWRSWGYCVPSAKPAPIQSFFRCFDLGHCTIPLGSFGPAMGTPYAAAYPRPLLCMAAGNDRGWACFGAGEIPDGAMSLKIRNSNGCIEFLMREDLWGTPAGQVRHWGNPLEVTFAMLAYDAFDAYFRRLPVRRRGGIQRSNFDVWGTWGEFKEQVYNLDPLAARTAELLGESVLNIDDGWETFNSSGIPRTDRFPDFKQSLEQVRSHGLKVGLWQSLGWLDDLEVAGLQESDVLSSAVGVPIKVNWQLDPRTDWKRHFCPDPSSANAERFIHERTCGIIERYRPFTIKFDFTYGVPGPDHCAPRDPRYRGERYAARLMQIASDACTAMDPEIRVYGHCLNPLYHGWVDFVSLDDLGDCGAEEAAGHGQWSVWASLLGARGMAITGSSGYDWKAESDILMNSAVIGAPGGNLRLDQPIAARRAAARSAIHRWYRRPTQWKPVWFNSHRGDLVNGDPVVRNFGRMENHCHKWVLTALALRDGPLQAPLLDALAGVAWSGKWILIAQSDHDLWAADRLAVIPMTEGQLRLPKAFAFAKTEIVFRHSSKLMAVENASGAGPDLCTNELWEQEHFLGFVLSK
jgi:hypothetical protein